jgi:hypothetical protein
MENRFAVTENVKAAIIMAATEAMSFKALAALVEIESVALQLIADGHITHVSAKTLKAMMPKIIGFLSGNEKKTLVKFIALNN